MSLLMELAVTQSILTTYHFVHSLDIGSHTYIIVNSLSVYGCALADMKAIPLQSSVNIHVY